MSPEDSGAVEAMYRALGLRVPLEGIPDDQRKCQVLSCSRGAVRTMFMQHKSADFPLRLWLCDDHARSIQQLKPIGVRVLYEGQHLESISMEDRQRGKDLLTSQIHAYCLENLCKPGEIRWEWTWIEGFDDTTGKPIKGMELLGTASLEKVELDAYH